MNGRDYLELLVELAGGLIVAGVALVLFGFVLLVGTGHW